MIRLAHLSDLHLTGAPGDRERVGRLFESLRRERASHVLVTGDITDGGERRGFEILEEARRDAGYDEEKFFVVPGNHDLPGLATMQALFSCDVPCMVGLSPHLGLVLLNSAVVGGALAREVHNPAGRLSRKMWAFLDSLGKLSRRTDHLFAAVHHHVIDVADVDWIESLGRVIDLWGPIDDFERVQATMESLGVDAVLCGHAHERKHVKTRRGRGSCQVFIAGATLDQQAYGLHLVSRRGWEPRSIFY